MADAGLHTTEEVSADCSPFSLSPLEQERPQEGGVEEGVAEEKQIDMGVEEEVSEGKRVPRM